MLIVVDDRSEQNQEFSQSGPIAAHRPESAFHLVAHDDGSPAHVAADRDSTLPRSQNVDDMADRLGGLLLYTFPALLRQPLTPTQHGHRKVLGRRIEERHLLGLIKGPGTLGHGLAQMVHQVGEAHDGVAGLVPRPSQRLDEMVGVDTQGTIGVT